MKASDNVFPRLLLSEGASVSTPAAGTIAMFADSAGALYIKDDTGADTPVSGGGGDSSTITAVTISGGNATLNCAGGSVKNFTLTMTANATLAVSNLAGAGKATEFEIEIKQDGTGSRTLTLPSSFKALGGSDTAIASAANAVTVLSAKTFDNGTTWRYAMQESA